MVQPSISISKEQVASMPLVDLPGGIESITLVDSAAKAKMALRALNKCAYIGFDTETKPTFQRGGHMHKVALLQLSTDDHHFLFRLTVPGIFEIVRPLLENPDIIKVGLSVHDDYNALRRRGIPGPTGLRQNIPYRRHLAAEDICYNLRSKNIQRPAADKLGGCDPHGAAADIRGDRRMGMPETLQIHACRKLPPHRVAILPNDSRRTTKHPRKWLKSVNRHSSP